MNDPAPFVLASVPAVPADASQLTLHLDICRMRAELELLETRIERIRASEAEAAADSRPFVDRAQELVERTVASLYESGRADIETTDRESRLDAEARLADASRRAQELLAAAREELADALTARVEAAEPTQAPAVDVVILPDEGLIVLPGDDLVVLPDDGMVVLPGDAVDVPAGAGLVVHPGDDVLVVLPEHDEPVEFVATVEVVEPELVAEVPTLQLIAEPPTSEAVVDLVEPVASLEAPTDPTGSMSLPSLAASWGGTDVPSAPATTGATETVRADAAFDVWLAMAPLVEQVDESEQQVAEKPAGRPVWLRSLEAVAALLFVALAVAAGLYIVG